MKQDHFVFSSVYNGAIEKGVIDRVARIHAGKALVEYRRNTFDKVSKLIEFEIKEAVKDSKREKK